ncbi:MAG: hypothetical protein WBA93_30515 [Microcoleaceae cyanobacterium]
MTWLKLRKKVLHLMPDNSDESIDKVKVKSNPNNPTSKIYRQNGLRVPMRQKL